MRYNNRKNILFFKYDIFLKSLKKSCFFDLIYLLIYMKEIILFKKYHKKFIF